MKNLLNRKRYSFSPAYIDSGMALAYLVGVVWFAVWIAIQTSEFISPIWLGGSIVVVSLYQMAMLWLLRQYWEIDHIFGFFINNIICLGLYFGLAEAIIAVELPTSLPVLNLLSYEADSFSPGAVALSYAVIAIICGLVLVYGAYLIEKIKLVETLKRKARLHKIDLVIDHSLDGFSFWLGESRYGWFVVPIVLLMLVLSVVIGLALIFA